MVFIRRRDLAYTRVSSCPLYARASGSSHGETEDDAAVRAERSQQRDVRAQPSLSKNQSAPGQSPLEKILLYLEKALRSLERRTLF
jgi:hypothetical protein